MTNRIISFLLAILVLTTNAFALQVEAENISSEKYFESTLKELDSAQTSIVMAMYLVSVLPDQPDSQPNQLVNALISAKQRGVDVKVILDQNINFESESMDDAVVSNKNQKAYELLKKNNVSVFFDTSDVYTHAKAIVIDNEIVILGSTNWSKAALTRNNEENVLIRSKEFAESIINDLNKIKIQENIPQVLMPSVAIPKDFLSKKILGEMATNSDERAFDTYLYLLKEFDNNAEGVLTLDYDNLAKSLGIGSMSVEDYRRQINKVLDKLKDKYKLIKYEDLKRNQNTGVRLLNKNAKGEILNIPIAYWRLGWNNVLSFPAKVMYLINLSYTQTSHDNRFSISRENLSKSFDVSESFISDGNQELRYLNILDIQYSELENKSFDNRSPSIYMLKNLYDPRELKEALQKLEQKHGQDKLSRAVKMASLVFEENNPKTIEALIDLENKYGQQTVEEATNKISQKNPDNPKRSAGYLINTIKSMAKK